MTFSKYVDYNSVLSVKIKWTGIKASQKEFFLQTFTDDVGPEPETLLLRYLYPVHGLVGT